MDGISACLPSLRQDCTGIMQVVHVPTDDLLSKEYAKQRRAAFYNPEKVGAPCSQHVG